VPIAEPVKVSAGTVPEDPENAGTLAGQVIVPAGVPALTACDRATAADVVTLVVVMPQTAARLVPVPNVAGAVPRKFVVPEALGS
jgi:hypothetical protein